MSVKALVIDLMHKWWPINFSFIFMKLISVVAPRHITHGEECVTWGGVRHARGGVRHVTSQRTSAKEATRQ